jgi:single-strand DNA-binding protein
MNRETLLGHVGRNPELHTTQQGNKVARFSLATSERWKDKATGELKERAEWHSIVVWNESLVGLVEKYVKKGQQIYLEGTIRTREYEKDGVKKWTTEIVLQGYDGRIQLLGKRDDSGKPGTAPLADAEPPRDGGSERKWDDEIPF